MTDRPYWCEICARKKECYGITLKPKCFVPTADRKTESNSEKPNNSTISKMEQVDEPNCEECKHFNEQALTYMKQCKYYFMECRFEPKDEPQTCDDCIWTVCNYNKAFEDEPQTERNE